MGGRNSYVRYVPYPFATKRMDYLIMSHSLDQRPTLCTYEHVLTLKSPPGQESPPMAEPTIRDSDWELRLEKAYIEMCKEADRYMRDYANEINEHAETKQRLEAREKRLVEALREIDCLGDSCHVSRLQEVARQTLTELGYDPD